MMGLDSVGELVSLFGSNVVVAGSFGLKVPQIFKILRTRSVLGLSSLSLYADVFVYTCNSLYHALSKYPFRTYGENVVILAQNLVCVGLLWRYTESGPHMKHAPALFAAYAMCILGIAKYLPQHLYAVLAACATPLLLLVNIPQIHINWAQKHTGQLAWTTVAMRAGGSALRVVTTIHEIGMNIPLLLNYNLSLVLNAVLLGQCWAYRHKTAAVSSSNAQRPQQHGSSAQPAGHSAQQLLTSAQQQQVTVHGGDLAPMRLAPANAQGEVVGMA